MLVRYGVGGVPLRSKSSLVIGVVTSLCVSMTIARRWIFSARCQSRSSLVCPTVGTTVDVRNRQSKTNTEIFWSRMSSPFVRSYEAVSSRVMSILIAEDNMAQRHYLREILEKEFPSHVPVFEAGDGEETVKLALGEKPEVCILDIQMPKLSGVKAARAIWREFPTARIIFWTQFPHEIYINEIRKIVKSVDPPPAYGFIHKNNPESRFLRFVAAVLEDGADMIDPAFKDSFKRPLLTEFEAE